LGFKLHQEGIWLEQFASLEQRRSSRVTTKLALEWATLPHKTQPAYLTHRLSVVRGFAHYHAARDPRTEVPPLGLLPHRYRRKPPYIYTDDEIARLLEGRAFHRRPTERDTGLVGLIFSPYCERLRDYRTNDGHVCFRALAAPRGSWLQRSPECSASTTCASRA
jgi:site-specific recombinase XerD